MRTKKGRKNSLPFLPIVFTYLLDNIPPHLEIEFSHLSIHPETYLITYAYSPSFHWYTPLQAMVSPAAYFKLSSTKGARTGMPYIRSSRTDIPRVVAGWGMRPGSVIRRRAPDGHWHHGVAVHAGVLHLWPSFGDCPGSSEVRFPPRSKKV